MLALTEEHVGMLSCRILNIVMEVGEVPEENVELENSINVDFNIISDAANDRPIGIDLLSYFKIDEGSVFSLDVTARVIFDIPEEYSDEDAAEYLGKFGATRAFDSIRPYVEYISTAAGFPMIEVPPVVVTMN